MKTWRANGDPSAAQIEEIAAVLKANGVVLMPTDTIYGLHALANSETAAARIAAIKGRDESKRFVLLAASVDQVASLGCVVPSALHQIWPAPLTAILQCGDSTLAVRVPDLTWLRFLLEQTGPLISTSANRSGEEPITAPDELDAMLRGTLDGVVEAGRREGKPSTIVDFTSPEPRLIRNGDPGFTQMLRKTLRKCL